MTNATGNVLGPAATLAMMAGWTGREWHPMHFLLRSIISFIIFFSKFINNNFIGMISELKINDGFFFHTNSQN